MLSSNKHSSLCAEQFRHAFKMPDFFTTKSHAELADLEEYQNLLVPS